jgi:hypothetical protein
MRRQKGSRRRDSRESGNSQLSNEQFHQGINLTVRSRRKNGCEQGTTKAQRVASVCLATQSA